MIFLKLASMNVAFNVCCRKSWKVVERQNAVSLYNSMSLVRCCFIPFA